MKPRHAVAVCAVLLLAVAAGMGLREWFACQQALAQPLSLQAAVVYELEPGTSLVRLSEDFEARGWIPRAQYLQLAAWRSDLAKRIQAGAYDVLPSDTPMSLLQKFAAGRVKEYAITLPEGIRFSEMLAEISAAPGVTRTLVDASPAEILRRVGSLEGAPEGWFYPDTWHYRHRTTDLDLLTRAHRKLRLVLDREWAARAEGLVLKTPYEALILASIVEKETAVEAERARIAGVFLRRLKLGMKLQTDPTVIYGLGAAFNGNLTRADLLSDQPFNTYTRHGLPPTPICSPGASSLRAVLHPADGDELYFVARGDGSHVFSSTLAAHNAAVREFQQKAAKP